MEDWVSNIYRLAIRLQAFRADGILNRDRVQAPQTLRSLQTRLNQERDPAVGRNSKPLSPRSSSNCRTSRRSTT